MTRNERELWINKCAELLHYVLVDIRALSWQPGNERMIERLADISHNLPHFMIGRDDAIKDYVRDEFYEMSKERWPNVDPASTKYVALIDMPDDSFFENYRQASWAWPEPESATTEH